MKNSDTIWGVDLGGTKIECAVLESKSKHVLVRERIPTNQHEGYESILANIKNIVNIAAERTGLYPYKIGFGVPGVLDSDGDRLKNSNTTCLNGKELKKDIEKLLQIPVKMANDANCFALAETHMGIVPDVSPNAETVFGIILGTGVGGGIVVNGHVLQGRHGIAGEWGHNFLDESGGQCYCGRIGCVETVVSGPALEKYYYGLSKNRISLKKIASQLASDEYARQTISRLVKMFGKAVATVINILDPDVIVVGGGVGNIDQIYSDSADEIKKYLFNPVLHTKIVRPKLGDSAGVFGAAMLVLEDADH